MKVEEIITNQIIEALEKGTIPWKKPWLSIPPQNFVSKREYEGINFLLLAMLDYKNPYYLTFNQVNTLGAKVKKGAKGHPVVYWGVWEGKNIKKEEDEEEHIIPFMRYYKVFNIDQCEGIEIPKQNTHKKKSDCEIVFKTYPNAPRVTFGGNQAYYAQVKDKVVVPDMTRFADINEYYATIFHELVHSTGHPKRLNRFNVKDSDMIFGKESYSREELVAELGSAFLCANFGIDNSHIQQSASYIQGWLKALNNDKSLVIRASGKARKAKNYILGKETNTELAIDKS